MPICQLTCNRYLKASSLEYLSKEFLRLLLLSILSRQTQALRTPSHSCGLMYWLHKRESFEDTGPAALQRISKLSYWSGLMKRRPWFWIHLLCLRVSGLLSVCYSAHLGHNRFWRCPGHCNIPYFQPLHCPLQVAFLCLIVPFPLFLIPCFLSIVALFLPLFIVPLFFSIVPCFLFLIPCSLSFGHCPIVPLSFIPLSFVPLSIVPLSFVPLSFVPLSFVPLSFVPLS